MLSLGILLVLPFIQLTIHLTLLSWLAIKLSNCCNERGEQMPNVQNTLIGFAYKARLMNNWLALTVQQASWA